MGLGWQTASGSIDGADDGDAADDDDPLAVGSDALEDESTVAAGVGAGPDGLGAAGPPQPRATNSATTIEVGTFNARSLAMAGDGPCDGHTLP